MRQRRAAAWTITVAGVAMLALPGCSGNKVVTASGESGLNGTGAASSTESADANGYSGQYGQNGYGQGSQEGQGSQWSQGSGDNAVPSLSAKGEAGSYGDGGALRGFERLAPGQSPSEERLHDGSILSRMMGDDTNDKLLAALRRQEEAAIAAGLKDAFFGYDRAAIVEDAREALSVDAEWIKAHPTAQLKVSGHCDERGTQDYNLVLGDKRAKSVKRYLVDLGVPAPQVSTISFGKNRPFCGEHDEACHKQNRRGHFLLSE